MKKVLQVLVLAATWMGWDLFAKGSFIAWISSGSEKNESMLMPCEVAVKCVLPVIRSALTKKLTQEYGLTQTETANLLGITQPAVSHYLRKVRGNALDLEQDEEFRCLMREIAAMVYGKDASSQEILLGGGIELSWGGIEPGGELNRHGSVWGLESYDAILIGAPTYHRSLRVCL